VKLLRRCGPNLKLLVISFTTLSPDKPGVAFDKAASASVTRSLLCCAFREAPCLESLVTNCPMDAGQLLELVDSCRPPSQLKRFHLVGSIWSGDDTQQCQDPNWRYITPTQFTRVLAALPALECLDLRNLIRPIGRGLSFGGTNCALRELFLPLDGRLALEFPTGQQLRGVVTQFPLLERLGWLTIQRRTEYGEITQADIDFFCANATR
jgi:hypothetical protein